MRSLDQNKHGRYRGLGPGGILRAAAVALALGACAAPRSAPAPSGAPVETMAAGTSPVRIRGAAYELYAPTDTIAQAVRRELDRAASTFERYFGAAPPPIAVVVFNSTAEMRSFDWAPLRARFARVLPWPVQFGETPTLAASPVEGQRALAHEACHIFLIGYTGAKLGRPERGSGGGAQSYGDPALPDWYDEGVATLCEPAELRATRVLPRDSSIAFPELFRMEHPAWRALQARINAQRANDTSRAAARPEVIRMSVTRDMLGGSRAPFFYAQTNSVLEFMADREGPTFVGRLGDELARGRTVEQALMAHARRLPHDVAGLEREWKAWAAAR